MLLASNNITNSLIFFSIVSFLVLIYYTYVNKYKLYIIPYILLSLNFFLLQVSNIHTNNFINNNDDKEYKLALSINIFIALTIISAMVFVFSLNIT